MWYIWSWTGSSCHVLVKTSICTADWAVGILSLISPLLLNQESLSPCNLGPEYSIHDIQLFFIVVVAWIVYPLVFLSLDCFLFSFVSLGRFQRERKAKAAEEIQFDQPQAPISSRPTNSIQPHHHYIPARSKEHMREEDRDMGTIRKPRGIRFSFHWWTGLMRFISPLTLPSSNWLNSFRTDVPFLSALLSPSLSLLFSLFYLLPIMSATGAGYDYSVSTFSPNGRVFQVEYAAKAVEKSGSETNTNRQRRAAGKRDAYARDIIHANPSLISIFIFCIVWILVIWFSFQYCDWYSLQGRRRLGLWEDRSK